MDWIIDWIILTRSTEDVILEEVQCVAAIKGVTVCTHPEKRMVSGILQSRQKKKKKVDFAFLAQYLY